MKAKECEHIATARSAQYERKSVCEECEKTGDSWVHLRTCTECGQTLCCDSSPNKHMTNHALTHEHHVVQSAEPGENWYYCYADKLFVKE